MTKHSQKIVRAKELRRNMPKAEVILWQQLRMDKMGVKFRRQRPVGPYFVDFICLEKKLIIELDGLQHTNDIEYDNRRTDFLEKHGYQIIRIPNEFIYKELDAVIWSLQKVIDGEENANDWFYRKYDTPPPPPKSC